MNLQTLTGTKPNTRLLDLIFDAVKMKMEITRCQIRDSERNLERLTRKYGCGTDDLAAVIECGSHPITREDALFWCGELVRLERLRGDYSHLALLG